MSILSSFFGSGNASAVLDNPVQDNTPVAQPEPEPAAKAEPTPEPVKYGARWGQLTQFGSKWIDLSAIEAIDFEPVDGCGAEVSFGKSRTLHLCDADAAVLGRFLTETAEFPF